MNTLMDPSFAWLLVRLVVGMVLVGHGARKLFGWFGGQGLEGAEDFMRSLGLPAPALMAVLAASAEFFGGLALALGLFPRVGAVFVIGSMAMAILAVHLGNGLWNADNGYEFPLTLATAALAIGIAGPGAYSIQAAYGTPTLPPLYLWVGVVGAVLFDAVLNVVREPERGAASA